MTVWHDGSVGTIEYQKTWLVQHVLGCVVFFFFSLVSFCMQVCQMIQCCNDIAPLNALLVVCDTINCVKCIDSIFILFMKYFLWLFSCCFLFLFLFHIFFQMVGLSSFWKYILSSSYYYYTFVLVGFDSILTPEFHWWGIFVNVEIEINVWFITIKRIISSICHVTVQTQ